MKIKRRDFIKSSLTVSAGMLSNVGLASLRSNQTTVSFSPDKNVLVEAEQFDDLGGWVIDQQFMDQMGSPYLLAHGLGNPVKDATTYVKFPRKGKYRVWVRTKDWVAPWNAPGAPGKFEIHVNNKPLKTIFGTEGDQWHWQDGGLVSIKHKNMLISIHDLTGFEGRCDAILFTRDHDMIPPDEGNELEAMRMDLGGISRELKYFNNFDLVVTGGGIAGTCTAISAARHGAKVALVQDRPVCGGNNSSEVRVWLGGTSNCEPYPRVGDIVRELEQTSQAHYGPDNTADLYEDEKKLALLKNEENISLFLWHRANSVQTQNNEIKSVIVQDILTGQRKKLSARYFADCTGDGSIGYMAGADSDITVNNHMGRCNLWNIKETDSPVSFPKCPWAFNLYDKPFPGREKNPGQYGTGLTKLGGWYWESGFKHHPVKDGEYIRDTNFRAMYGAWDCLKNKDKVYQNYKLNWAAYISGKRESRRLMGDIVLSKEKLLESEYFDDACVPATWSIDLHLPHKDYNKGFKNDAFISKAHYTHYPRPYWVPYRALYSRNINNLFMAGIDISVTHEALGSVRVMRTCGMEGEIIGMAVRLCKKYGVDPRAIYTHHLDDLKLLMKKTTYSEWPAKTGKNLAASSKINVSGSHNINEYPVDHIANGKIHVYNNELRWISDDQLPHIIEFTWPKDIKVNAARVISGERDRELDNHLNGEYIISKLVRNFHFEYRKNNKWLPIPGGKVLKNKHYDCKVLFNKPVQTSKMRLVITDADEDISRIWEVGLYDFHKISTQI